MRSLGGQASSARLYVKGAAEIILQRCASQLNADCSVSPLPEADSSSLLQSFSTAGLR